MTIRCHKADKAVKTIALYWKFMFIKDISQSCMYGRITTAQMPLLLADIRAGEILLLMSDGKFKDDNQSSNINP